MTPLTPRETDCLNVIRLLTKDSVSPSYREIANYMGIKSVAGVAAWVEALEAKGRIRRSAHRSRSIEIIDPLSVEIARLCATFGPEAVRAEVMRS